MLPWHPPLLSEQRSRWFTKPDWHNRERELPSEKDLDPLFIGCISIIYSLVLAFKNDVKQLQQIICITLGLQTIQSRRTATYLPFFIFYKRLNVLHVQNDWYWQNRPNNAWRAFSYSCQSVIVCRLWAHSGVPCLVLPWRRQDERCSVSWLPEVSRWCSRWRVLQAARQSARHFPSTQSETIILNL